MSGIPVLAIFDLEEENGRNWEKIFQRLFPDQKIDKDAEGRFIWRVNTKYYEAEVEVKLNPEDDGITTTIEAYVISAAEFKAESELPRVQRIKEKLTKTESTFQTELILVDKFTRDEDRAEVMDWCIDQGIEVVDLSEEDQDEFSSGNRVVEALHACMWSNMDLKRGEKTKPGCISHVNSRSLNSKEVNGDKSESGRLVNDANSDDAAKSNVNSERTNVDAAKSESQSNDANSTNGAASGSGGGAEDADDPSTAEAARLFFEGDTERLFAEFERFSKIAKNMTDDEERRKYAEKLVWSYWRALDSGDEDEGVNHTNID